MFFARQDCEEGTGYELRNAIQCCRDKPLISGAGTAAASWRARPLMLPSGSKEIVIASGILFWKWFVLKVGQKLNAKRLMAASDKISGYFCAFVRMWSTPTLQRFGSFESDLASLELSLAISSWVDISFKFGAVGRARDGVNSNTKAATARLFLGSTDGTLVSYS